MKRSVIPHELVRGEKGTKPFELIRTARKGARIILQAIEDRCRIMPDELPDEDYLMRRNAAASVRTLRIHAKQLSELRLVGIHIRGKERRYSLNYVIFASEEWRQKLINCSYKQYLKSPHWKSVRAKALERSGKKCERCGSATKIQVHHKTYQHRGWEHKHMEDLEVLCRNCHRAEHGIEGDE